MKEWHQDVELLEERFCLAAERIQEIKEEAVLPGQTGVFFQTAAGFLCRMLKQKRQIEENAWKQASLEELRENNHELYQEQLPEQYKSSFLNPACAVEKLGTELGRMLSFLYSELYSLIAFVYERKLMDITIRMELFIEVYSTFACAWEETKKLPPAEEIREILYWFISDYQDVETEMKIAEQLGAAESFALPVVMESDLSDIRYLYQYGEYVTENEERMAAYFNSLSEETVKLMADTYTEGYRIGFQVGNKDITKKKTVGIYYRLGFERMVRQAVLNFEKIGLKAILFRTPVSALTGRSLNKSGFYGAAANRQYDYDHDEDQMLFLDKNYINRRLDVLKAAYEAYKEEAAVYGGPAVIETFGEEPFAPEVKEEACHLTSAQQKLSAGFSIEAGALINQYIKGEERSFTIIAFPIPAIGQRFEEIFDEIIRINTLDYQLYQRLQQCLIDALDEAEYVEIKGMNGNRTDLRVALHALSAPQKETNFENCVADVNIPVGEVFTSPRLKGTNGILHVKKVFLHDLEYRDLEIVFKDGMTDTYSCGNFEKEEDGKKYIKDNVLNHHPSLPMGEFAIGTNTTAYVAARKFQIEDKLPILIAEKMGPHFAVGDTCYSHAEDVKVYNPDGKEIVAKENEVSGQRKSDPSSAYFSCHTDITIPYDELLSLDAVKKDGSRISLIEKGRFVLPGAEELNKPLNLGLQ